MSQNSKVESESGQLNPRQQQILNRNYKLNVESDRDGRAAGHLPNSGTIFPEYPSVVVLFESSTEGQYSLLHLT